MDVHNERNENEYDVPFSEGSDLPPQRIDQSLLVSNQQRATVPDKEPSFQQYDILNPEPRPDMADLRTITMRNEQNGKDIWSGVCKSETLFRIRSTMQCDRTFARDIEEVYYLDHMHAWLNGLPQDIMINDLPLVKRSLHQRLMYAFSRPSGYFTEHFEPRRMNMWLPFDHPENKHYGDIERSERYPSVDAWVHLIQQPSALPVPVPFVVFYFPSGVREAQRRKFEGLPLNDCQRRLLFCLENEYYVLFLAMWWSEAKYGCRQFVLNPISVQTLTEHCSELNLIGIKPAQVILDYMQHAVTLSSEYHVWLAFRGNWMEESITVWAKKNIGVHDPSYTPLRTTFYIDKKLRRLTITGHSSKLYKRNVVLHKSLSDPDLDKIPGRWKLVQEQNWNLQGEMRVRDLLCNLMNLYNCTRNTVDTLIRQRQGGNPSRPPNREDRNQLGDNFLRAEPPVRLVGYHNADGPRNERHQNGPYEERIRSSRYSPPLPHMSETTTMGTEITTTIVRDMIVTINVTNLSAGSTKVVVGIVIWSGKILG